MPDVAGLFPATPNERRRELRAGERDLVVTAAGGLPGEVMKNWRVKAPNTFDREFGFSRMGYEIAAGWGAAMADVASRQ
ncbi:hypothetical protein NKI48_27530 [Mesorhizobium sp. M0644]|uniref:hypothetical protein n=1 Tax=unclassified Mesorhizobium TaxID=325217 RepID=UPI0033383F91